MRTSIITFVGALVVAFAALTQAQDTTPPVTQAPAAPATTPKLGQIDFGYRAESLTGDEARFNRLRDVRDGGYIDRFRFENDSPSRSSGRKPITSATATSTISRPSRRSADWRHRSSGTRCRCSRFTAARFSPATASLRFWSRMGSNWGCRANC